MYDFNEYAKKFQEFLLAIGYEKYISYAEGFMVADLDKCNQYFPLWKQKGITENRGSMLYLITKLSPFSEEARVVVTANEWVQKHYDEFKDVFDALNIA